MSEFTLCNTKNWQRKFPYGRWNNTNTNLKLFPMTICNGANGQVIKKQTKNLYRNTSWQIPQSKMFSFLVRNQVALRR